MKDEENPKASVKNKAFENLCSRNPIKDLDLQKPHLASMLRPTPRARSCLVYVTMFLLAINNFVCKLFQYRLAVGLHAIR